MRINFLIPFISKTGGIAVILQHAKGLRALGHDVVVYYPLLPYRSLRPDGEALLRKILLGQAKPFLGNLLRRRTSIPWRGDIHPVVPIPWVTARLIRDADAIIATAWPTAYSVAGLPASKGRKYYFVQSYEVWDWDPVRVDPTYRLPLDLITIAPWITDLMETRFSRRPMGEVRNGVDLETFRPPVRRDWSRPAILMLYHAVEVKGIVYGLEALERIHGRFPGVCITLFGVYPRPELPDFISYHRDPPLAEIARLYQEATIFLSPSLWEGWQLPPMEAMACGCAVVATSVGCIPTLDDGTNMLVVPPRDVDGLVRHLEALLADPNLGRRIGGNGRRTIESYTWERSTSALAGLLERAG